jgi:hypothetical protein
LTSAAIAELDGAAARRCSSDGASIVTTQRYDIDTGSHFVTTRQRYEMESTIGRPPVGKIALTAAERMRRYRRSKRSTTKPGPKPSADNVTATISSSELSALIRVRDEISKEDQARWLAVVELSLFLTRAWADFLFPDKELPHARELMLVGGVIFIWDLKGKPLTETGVSRVIAMPRATLARRIDLLIKEGWVIRCRNRYYFDFDKFGRQRQLSSHLRSLSRAIMMAARRLPDRGSS